MNERKRGIYYPWIKMNALPKFFQSTQLKEKDFVNTFLDSDQQYHLTYSALRIRPDRKKCLPLLVEKTLDCHDSKPL